MRSFGIGWDFEWRSRCFTLFVLIELVVSILLTWDQVALINEEKDKEKTIRKQCLTYFSLQNVD